MEFQNAEICEMTDNSRNYDLERKWNGLSFLKSRTFKQKSVGWVKIGINGPTVISNGEIKWDHDTPCFESKRKAKALDLRNEQCERNEVSILETFGDVVHWWKVSKMMKLQTML